MEVKKHRTYNIRIINGQYLRKLTMLYLQVRLKCKLKIKIKSCLGLHLRKLNWKISFKNLIRLVGPLICIKL